MFGFIPPSRTLILLTSFANITLFHSGSVDAQSRSTGLDGSNVVTKIEQAPTTSKWLEVRGSTPSVSRAATSDAESADGEGDRVHIVEQGDTLRAIALKHTGSVEHWDKIAEKNNLSEPFQLVTGSVLIVPESLLAVASTRQYDSVIQEFDRPESIRRPIAKSSTQADHITPPNTEKSTPVLTPIDVTTRNVDMFKGQVSVFGKVAVERVAVGRGSIVRAEVLKTGELLVIAQEKGSTSLRLWHKNGQQTDFNIRVAEADPETRFHIEKMIRMKVKMVEFRKSALGRLGIDWGDSVAGPTFATAGDFVTNSLYRPATEGFGENLSGVVKPFSSYFGIASSLASKINFLSTSGDAVVLAEPTLSCANGSTARFLAGGEVPYPTVQANGQTSVEFKEYGIRLEIAPRIDTAGNIQTAVLTEISSIDPSVSVQGAPGLLTRRTQTQVNVQTGQTIVISGLLRAENSKDIDKVPGIGNLPILGRLFKSDNLRNDISELVIFITPEVMNTDDGALDERHRVIHEQSDKALLQKTRSLNLNLLE